LGKETELYATITHIVYGGFDFVWGRKSLRLIDMKGSDHGDGGNDNGDMMRKIWPKNQDDYILAFLQV